MRLAAEATAIVGWLILAIALFHRVPLEFYP